jgi:teichoic acid transport system permease protein
MQERGVNDPRAPMRSRLAAHGRHAPGAGGLIGPGELQDGSVAVLSPDHQGEPLATYAVRHGLRPSAQRPTVGAYLYQLWRRMPFILAYATARNVAMYTEAKLGQLWQVLTPLLNAGVYFLIFGLLLKINRGVPNYLAFLVTGVFVFNFTQRVFLTTSNVMRESLPLIRALQFPRASLPLAYVMVELQQMALSMVVLIIIVLVTGEPVTWYWLLVIPALALQTLFNAGVGLLVARLGAQLNDFSQLLPFLMRTWLYVSGVLYSISNLNLNTAPQWVITVLELNPAALYITLVRNALLRSQRLSQPGAKAYNSFRCHLWNTLGHSTNAKYAMYQTYSAYCHPHANPHYYWYWAIGWAVLALVAGFFFFWQAETRYGRG